MNIIIRNEQTEDYKEVENLTREAFWNLHFPGCDEHYLVHTMRSHRDFLPELAFVAESNGKIIGNIMFSKSYLQDEDNNKVQTLTFGPLAVLPAYQRSGVGTMLIRHSLEAIKDWNIPAIIILGHPHNYVKHGFKNGKDYLISDPEGNYPLGLLVLALDNQFFGQKHWKFFYSDIFEPDPAGLEIFDKQFPHKEKSWQYSQELFSMICRAKL
jgi:predicted N-acetyltransferase YhbS